MKEGRTDPFARGEELLEILQRGKRFTEELLTENERLRFHVVKIEGEKLAAEGALATARAHGGEENQQLRVRLEHLEKRFAEAEEENHDFAKRYSEVSQENESLANLYVASHRLHSTLDPQEVTEIVCEIMVEMVGAEEFAILLLDERTNELTPVRVEGPMQAYPAHMLVGQGTIGVPVAQGKACYDESAAAGQPLAVVPLQIKGHSVGALVVIKLLHGRRRFDTIARELLGLLAGHAATALVSSRLYSGVDRKLRTIESFLDLLKKPQPSRARAGMEDA